MAPTVTWRMLKEHFTHLSAHPHDKETRFMAIQLLRALTDWLLLGGFPPTIEP